MERISVVRFLGGKKLRKLLLSDRSVLEAAFLKNWHIEPANSSDPVSDNLPFQRVELLMAPVCKFNEGDRLGYFDHTRQGERAEATKAEVRSRCTGPDMATALATAVSKRVLDGMDAPTLLVEHQIVKNASNR